MLTLRLLPEEHYPNYRDSAQDAKEQLDKIIKEEIDGGFPIKELTGDNNPVEEIFKVVRDERVDLFVMSAHEEGRIDHALNDELTLNALSNR